MRRSRRLPALEHLPQGRLPLPWHLWWRHHGKAAPAAVAQQPRRWSCGELSRHQWLLHVLLLRCFLMTTTLLLHLRLPPRPSRCPMLGSPPDAARRHWAGPRGMAAAAAAARGTSTWATWRQGALLAPRHAPGLLLRMSDLVRGCRRRCCRCSAGMRGLRADQDLMSLFGMDDAAPAATERQPSARDVGDDGAGVVGDYGGDDDFGGCDVGNGGAWADVRVRGEPAAADLAAGGDVSSDAADGQAPPRSRLRYDFAVPRAGSGSGGGVGGERAAGRVAPPSTARGVSAALIPRLQFDLGGLKSREAVCHPSSSPQESFTSLGAYAAFMTVCGCDDLLGAVVNSSRAVGGGG